MDPKVQQQLLDDLTRQSEKVNQLLSSHGPQAWQAILELTRFQGIAWLVYGLIGIILGIIGLRFTPRLFKKAQQLRDDGDDVDFIYLIGSSLLGSLGLASLVGGICTVLDVWNWVAVFYPQIYLLHNVIDKVTKGN